MAERGAHLTGTTFAKPSIFEIIAQESLASTLEPAFRKIFSFLVICNPERYGHLLRWSDEGFLVFNAVLQRYYFQKYSASFSETFYELKRVGLVNSKLVSQLSRKQKVLSLLVIVVVPYLRAKLSKLSEKYKLEELEGHVPKKRWEKFFRTFVVKGFVTGCMLYECLKFYNYLLYVSGHSTCPTPILRLLSITLTYSKPQQVLSISELLSKIRHNSFGLGDGLEIVQRSVARSIELGAFFLQFVSWWTRENYSINVMALPVPPAPKVPKAAEKYKGICPVCQNPPRVHTVLSISGYVFCYRCILSVIRETKKCPVTNYPATEDDLIRLYID